MNSLESIIYANLHCLDFHGTKKPALITIIKKKDVIIRSSLDRWAQRLGYSKGTILVAIDQCESRKVEDVKKWLDDNWRRIKKSGYKKQL